MNVMEYAAKEIFEQYGIPTPEGYTVTSPDEIQEVHFPVVVKAQVQTGGRGKAGGIKFANTTEEAKRVAGEILGMDIKGHTVRRLLIERRLNVEKELYLGIVVDRSAGKLRCLASASGGMDIEAVPKDQLFSYPFDLEEFLSDGALDKMIEVLGLCGIHNDATAEMARRLYQLFTEKDATLVEINPLIITHEGELIAADAKLVIDNDALWRHPELPAPEDEYTPLEQRARADGIAFVQLDGDIGVIANGAGLTMATLDALRSVGGHGGTAPHLRRYHQVRHRRHRRPGRAGGGVSRGTRGGAHQGPERGPGPPDPKGRGPHRGQEPPGGGQDGHRGRGR